MGEIIINFPDGEDPRGRTYLHIDDPVEKAGFEATMADIKSATVVGGRVDGDNLVLSTNGGSEVVAGNVRGRQGDKGLDGANVLPTDEAVAQAITTQGSETQTQLNATFVGQDEFTGVFTWRDGPGGELTVKPLGDGSAGLWELVHDDNRGFLFHLHTGPNSTDNTAVIGIGTDRGQGNGLLVSHKNTGAGIHLTQHPGSGRGLFAIGWSATTPVIDALIFAGAQPVKIRSSQSAGFNDGVTSSGSTTFTSASANFTAADIGKTLAQLTSVEGIGIPNSSTTITAVTNATTVVMASAAPASRTGLRFSVGGRMPVASQALLQMADYNGDVLFNFTRTATQLYKPLQVMASAASTADQTMQRSNQLRFYRHSGAGANFFAHYLTTDTGTSGEMQWRAYASAVLGSEAASAAAIRVKNDGTLKVGFFDTAPTARPSGVAATAAGIHAALVTLGLISA